METERTAAEEHEGGKKEDLDGTLAASAYSQEDYQSCRCHKVPASSFLIGGRWQEDMYMSVGNMDVFIHL